MDRCTHGQTDVKTVYPSTQFAGGITSFFVIYVRPSPWVNCTYLTQVILLMCTSILCVKAVTLELYHGGIAGKRIEKKDESAMDI